MLDGLPLSRLHDPHVGIEIQTVRHANWRPDAMRAEPVVKVRDELEALPPCQDAAWPEDSAALLVDGLVVLPVLHGVASGRVEAPIVAAVFRRAVHGVGDYGVDGGGGDHP